MYSGNRKIGELYLGGTKIKEAYLGSTLVFKISEPPTPTGYTQYKFEVTISSTDNITSSGILVNGSVATASMSVGGEYITPWGRNSMSASEAEKYVTGSEQASMYCTTLAIIIEPGIPVTTLTWRPMSWQTRKSATFKLFGYDNVGNETLIETRETDLVGGTNVTFEV